jgi:TPP-dependent trihydroxycyclohexane-1,2-dione (THcHDO) dehydratase
MNNLRKAWLLLVVGLVSILVLAGCGTKSKEDVTSALGAKVEEMKGYESNAKMTLRTWRGWQVWLTAVVGLIPAIGCRGTSSGGYPPDPLFERQKPVTAKTSPAQPLPLAFTEPTRSPGDVQLSQIVRSLSDRLPHDTIICNGAGNYAVWVHRFWRYRQFRTELAPTSGSMGYGLPAAVAAKLMHPERTVIAFAGDGCFQMTGLEFMTAVENRLPLIVIVCNNGMYGTIRMHQERTYPVSVSGTDLANP